MKLGRPEFAIDYCYQATYTYTSTNNRLFRRALLMRATVLLALANIKNNKLTDKEKYLLLAIKDFAELSEKNSSKISTGYRNNKKNKLWRVQSK